MSYLSPLLSPAAETAEVEELVTLLLEELVLLESEFTTIAVNPQLLSLFYMNF